ncbi:MAG: hypothetical protein ACE1ZS_02145, partial [Candidatus Poribacteria bacterium]
AVPEEWRKLLYSRHQKKITLDAEIDLPLISEIDFTEVELNAAETQTELSSSQESFAAVRNYGKSTTW